ncbi:helix-turn-helix transcriptional regulator, partial [Streptomyces sp. NPDC056697]|uniref:helix-turn-helix transcriptional regulator n=1 Tax=Streptomyces sp. NPDC056697 TaxID=3345915 RepID=UPI00369C1DB7
IYTVRGKDGGIRLLDNYTLSKTLLSEKEQLEILTSLQGMKSLNVPEVQAVLEKLTTLFNIHHYTDWIDVDFSHWGSNEAEKGKFNMLKTAIVNSRVVTFDYYNSNGQKSKRTIEPAKVIFKGQAWYLQGFCQTRKALRIFKISRIKNLLMTSESFTRTEQESQNFQDPIASMSYKLVTVILQIDPSMAHRVYDEFAHDLIVLNQDGSFTVTVTYPNTEWLYGYILSFGANVEVKKPEAVKRILKQKLEDSLKKYL